MWENKRKIPTTLKLLGVGFAHLRNVPSAENKHESMKNKTLCTWIWMDWIIWHLDLVWKSIKTLEK